MKGRETEAALRAHIEALGGRECTWGTDDCCRWTADWAEARLGRSLGLPAYSSEDEARAIIARAGGLLALWTDHLSRNGIVEAWQPSPGDVGLIETARFGPIGVIFTYDSIGLWRAVRGVSAIKPRPNTLLKVWSIS